MVVEEDEDAAGEEAVDGSTVVDETGVVDGVVDVDRSTVDDGRVEVAGTTDVVVVEPPNDATEPDARVRAIVVVDTTTAAVDGHAAPTSTSTSASTATLPAARRPRWTTGTQFTCRVFPAQNGSRSLNFCSLPVAVRANASRNSTRLGHL